MEFFFPILLSVMVLHLINLFYVMIINPNSDYFTIWFNCTFRGYKKIRLYDGQHPFRDLTFRDFYTCYKPGHAIYRFPFSSIGCVKISETSNHAFYHVNYKWEYV